jgi:hypothetical protein
VGWSPFELPHDVEGRYQLSFIRNGHILFSLGGKSGGGVVVVCAMSGTEVRGWIEEISLRPLGQDTLIPLSVEYSKVTWRKSNERTKFGEDTTR